MIATYQKQADGFQPANTLFAATQPFLWLPGFSGQETPYCSYNEYRSDDSGDRGYHTPVTACDSNGARFVPLYPVSPETHVTWHTDVSPPYPYHPVPLARTLSLEEMGDLGRMVMELMDEPLESDEDPVAVLRNQRKSFVLAALARMNLLP